MFSEFSSLAAASGRPRISNNRPRTRYEPRLVPRSDHRFAKAVSLSHVAGADIHRANDLGRSGTELIEVLPPQLTVAD